MKDLMKYIKAVNIHCVLEHEIITNPSGVLSYPKIPESHDQVKHFSPSPIYFYEY